MGIGDVWCAFLDAGRAWLVEWSAESLAVETSLASQLGLPGHYKLEPGMGQHGVNILGLRPPAWPGCNLQDEEFLWGANCVRANGASYGDASCNTSPRAHHPRPTVQGLCAGELAHDVLRPKERGGAGPAAITRRLEAHRACRIGNWHTGHLRP